MSGSSSKKITVLSIDGGGVRGIIAGVMLEFLESELQILSPNTWLADYFDVISGTSFGGLIATIISASRDERPLFPARKIVPFFKKHCPRIFGNCNGVVSEEIHMKRSKTPDGSSTEVCQYDAKFEEREGLKEPFYDGEYLHKIVRDTFEERRLHDITVTKIVIPAYDIKKLSPVVFSSYQVEKNKVLDALLSDICISTSAAPIYLPAYRFTNEDQEFNCIGGGVAANNPTVAAIMEALKNKRSEEADGDKKIDRKDSKLLVLSLGTGENKEEKYSADLANSWWAINWLSYPFTTFWKAEHPLPEILFDASYDMNDYYCTLFFESFPHPQNFFRVQDDKLPKELSRLDNGTPENLDELHKYANDLLYKPVTSLTIGLAGRPTDRTKQNKPNHPLNAQCKIIKISIPRCAKVCCQWSLYINMCVRVYMVCLSHWEYFNKLSVYGVLALCGLVDAVFWCKCV